MSDTSLGTGTAGAVQATPRPRVQVVPVRGLPLVAAVVVFVVVSIAGNWLWALTFGHVVGGALWTAIDAMTNTTTAATIGSPRSGTIWIRGRATTGAEGAACMRPASVMSAP